ncbi:MAG TPA: hypothetical protein VJJ24_03195 [Candidatus Paceibacterota bacterium]
MNEAPNIEAEIAELSRQIDEKRRVLEESRGISVEHKEALAEVVREHVFKDQAPKFTPAPQPNPAVPPPSGGTTASGQKSYLDDLSPESATEVNRLIELVPTKGLMAAIAEAKNSDPFVLDAFHDALVDKLYDELKSRGLIK